MLTTTYINDDAIKFAIHHFAVETFDGYDYYWTQQSGHYRVYVCPTGTQYLAHAYNTQNRKHIEPPADYQE